MIKSGVRVLLSLVLFVPFLHLNGQELEVSPVTMSFATNPGSSQTKQLFLRNKAQTEQNFVFNVGDWLTDENGEVKYFDAGTLSRSCADWITISPSLVTLQPNESVRVNVTMLVPENEISTKWAVVFIQTAEEQTGANAIDKAVGMGIKLQPRIAVSIFQSPESNTLFKGTLEGLTANINEEGNHVFETQAINLGDKILNCKIYFTLSNMETAEEITSEPISLSLLPETSRNIKYTHKDILPKGQYSVAAILDYGVNEELEGIQMELEVK